MTTPKPMRRILSRDTVYGAPDPEPKRKQAPEVVRAETKKPGVDRFFPATWKRQAFIIHPDTNYALGMLARMEGVPISSIVNEALARIVFKQKGVIPWGERTAPESLADLMPPRRAGER